MLSRFTTFAAANGPGLPPGLQGEQTIYVYSGSNELREYETVKQLHTVLLVIVARNRMDPYNDS